MALFPIGGPRPASSEGERIFYRALLSHLPKGWTAWHSLRVRAGAFLEGESDFVIAVPDRAIVIVEVKGGSIECADGQWLQNGRPMDRAPREQAHRFRRILEQKLRASFRGDLPPMLIATAFPQTAFARPPTHGDLQDAVLGEQDMAWLGDALEAIIEKQLVGVPAKRDGGWSKALHALWGETWIPRVTLGTRIELREREIVPLDGDQIALMDMLDHSTRLLVFGGPGTGKSLCARAFAARRDPALYLCWTRALATAMRASGLANAWAIREYAAHLLERAGMPVQDGAPPEQWTTDTWNDVALSAAVDAVPSERSHEAVVVDEAQDFTNNDWLLAKALAGDGVFWAFGDPGQSFWPERTVPKELFPSVFQLKSRYRCPERLAAFADQYRPAGGSPISSAERPSSNELRVISVPDEGGLVERLGREVKTALADGARPAQIAVLSLRGQTKSELLKQRALGGVTAARADAANAATSLVVDTFLRFKGLERPLVFVTELDVGDKYDVRMHLAMTRATVRATVVGTAGQISSDARLTP